VYNQVVEEPYNPLDRRRLAESVARAMLERDVGPLPPAKSFLGAGIYAVYYTGDFKSYAPLAEQNRAGQHGAPIYVGKAIPRGSRKGRAPLQPSSSPDLYDRLREHADSIEEVANLNLDDFACRFLVVDDVWIPLAESMLIQWFSPLWNVVVTGFGIHDPGVPRARQQRSAWDTIHPGRAFAEKLSPNRRSEQEILELVTNYLSGAKQ
jgi:hypothetical protein